MRETKPVPEKNQTETLEVGTDQYDELRDSIADASRMYSKYYYYRARGDKISVPGVPRNSELERNVSEGLNQIIDTFTDERSLKGQAASSFYFSFVRSFIRDYYGNNVSDEVLSHVIDQMDSGTSDNIYSALSDLEDKDLPSMIFQASDVPELRKNYVSRLEHLYVGRMEEMSDVDFELFMKGVVSMGVVEKIQLLAASRLIKFDLWDRSDKSGLSRMETVRSVLDNDDNIIVQTAAKAGKQSDADFVAQKTHRYTNWEQPDVDVRNGGEESDRIFEALYNNDPDFFNEIKGRHWTMHVAASDTVAIADDAGVSHLYIRLNTEDVARITSGAKTNIVIPAEAVKKFYELNDDYIATTVNNLSIQDTRLLRRMYDYNFVQTLSNELGVALEKLPMSAQIKLLTLLADKDKIFVQRLKGVVDEGCVGSDFVMALLSTGDTVSVEDILSIAERNELSLQTKKLLFSRYADIITSSEKISDYFQYKFKSRPELEVLKESRKKMLARGERLVLDIINQLRNDNKNVSEQSILERISSCSADMVIFASAFRSLSEKESIELEDIDGVTIESMDSFNISDEEKGAMLAMVLESRGENKDAYPPAVYDLETGWFKNNINNPNTRYRILRDGSKVLAFMHTEQLPDGKVYAGSLTVSKEARASKLGPSLLKAVIEQEGKDKIITAKVNAKHVGWLKTLQDELGFVIVEKRDNYENTGGDYVIIERPAQLSSELRPT